MSEVTPGAAAQVPMNASQDGIPGVVPELSNVRGLITTPHAVLGSTQSDIIPASTMNLDIATIQDANETTKSVQTAEAHQDSVACLLYTSPSPRDQRGSRMPSSA